MQICQEIDFADGRLEGFGKQFVVEMYSESGVKSRHPLKEKIAKGTWCQAGDNRNALDFWRSSRARRVTSLSGARPPLQQLFFYQSYLLVDTAATAISPQKRRFLNIPFSGRKLNLVCATFSNV